MVQFESYERRVKQIDQVLAKYQFANLEEVRELCLSNFG